MTTNPIAQRRESPPANPTDLRAWCEEQNRKPLFQRMERWYFVVTTDGMERVDSIEGCDATNIRKMLAGTLEDFAGWSPKRMEGYRRWLWSCAERGLIESPRIAA